jgi:hypothetical protein
MQNLSFLYKSIQLKRCFSKILVEKDSFLGFYDLGNECFSVRVPLAPTNTPLDAKETKGTHNIFMVWS